MIDQNKVADEVARLIGRQAIDLIAERVRSEALQAENRLLEAEKKRHLDDEIENLKAEFKNDQRRKDNNQ